jgi:hypothetical protein
MRNVLADAGKQAIRSPPCPAPAASPGGDAARGYRPGIRCWRPAYHRITAAWEGRMGTQLIILLAMIVVALTSVFLT